MTDRLRIGAVAHVDDDPKAEVAFWREEAQHGRVDDPAATLAFLAALDRGEVVLVRLDLFAEVLEGPRVRRYDSVPVRAAQFRCDDTQGNARHAEELTRLHLDRLRDDLAVHGMAATEDELAQAPFRLELGNGLRARLEDR